MKTRVTINKSSIPGWILESEAKLMLRIGATTIWKLRMEGKLTWSRLGGRVYIKMDSIMKLLETNAVFSQ